MCGIYHKIYRKITALLIGVIMICLSCFALKASADSVLPADLVLTDREDFLWGVNTKNEAWRAYPTSNLEEQFYYMAQLGVKIVRTQQTGIDHLDKTMALAEAYGIKVMLNICSARKSDSEYDAETQFLTAKMYADRYNGKNGYGKVDYFCIDNELDVYLGVLGGKVGIDIGAGDKMSNYPEEDARRVCYQLSNAIAGVRAADTDAKIVINSTFIHSGFHEWLEECNVDYDIYGLDWYMDMTRYNARVGQSPMQYADYAYERFGKPVMICESNEWSNSPLNEDDPATYDTLVETMIDAYSKPHVVGYIMYELFDNLNGKTDEQAGGYSRENHFGLLYMDESTIIGPKASYNRLKSLWGGETVTKIKLDDIMNSQNAVIGGDSEENNSDDDNTESQNVVMTDDDNTNNTSTGNTGNNSPTNDNTNSDSADEGLQSEIVNSVDDEKTPDSSATVKKNKPGKFVWTALDTTTVIVSILFAAIIIFSIAFTVVRSIQIKKIAANKLA